MAAEAILLHTHLYILYLISYLICTSLAGVVGRAGGCPGGGGRYESHGLLRVREEMDMLLATLAPLSLVDFGSLPPPPSPPIHHDAKPPPPPPRRSSSLERADYTRLTLCSHALFALGRMRGVAWSPDICLKDIDFDNILQQRACTPLLASPPLCLRRSALCSG